MFQAILDKILGVWGRAAISFYFQNQTVINILFLVWAGIITIASAQLNKIRRKTICLGLDFLKDFPNLSDQQVWEAFRPKWQEEMIALKPIMILNRRNLWVLKATPENIIDIMKLGPDWFAALRNGEVLRYRFSIPGANHKLSTLIKDKPQSS